MPIAVSKFPYSKPFWMINPHWETIIPSVMNIGPKVNYSRKRMELSDGDFLDVDELKGRNSKCMIITHGLEGDSNRYYVRRTADYFHKKGWDIMAWNCRSCSGEINRLPRFYHHGETGDLHLIVQSAIQEGYEEIVLFGYSMGGSMSLKYLGESDRDNKVLGACTFSVPCNLRNSADVLKLRENAVYEKRFVKKLIEKMKIKAELYPDSIDVTGTDQLQDFDQFHERYTAPLHGFENADDFFKQSSCDGYFSGIKRPVYIGNALNDPMLGDQCYPFDIASKHEFIYLETPENGGHAGFTISGSKYSWMEYRAEEFMLTQGW